MTVAFGLPGVHNLAIWKALSESPIRLVGVRHEQAAVYAADGYARATGRLGVAVVTTGPGAANTLGATGEAMASGSPVLVIATDIPAAIRRPDIYRGSLHETRDQTAMFAPVTKAAHAGRDARPRSATRWWRVAHTALAAPSGPVYLGVPTDLLRRARARAPRRSCPRVAAHRAAFDGDGLDEARARSSPRRRRPLIWAGGGALRADAGDAVGALAHKLCAPVITTYMSRAWCRPTTRGSSPGPVHAPEVGALWDEADLVLGIGTDFDGMMTQNWLMPQPPRLVCVNVDAADATKNYAADVTLVGDAREVTQQLAAARRRARRRRGDAGAPRAGRAGVAAAVLADDADAARLPRRSWTARCPPTRWWSPTCASPATGWPATGGSRGRARSPIRWAGGRSASRFPAVAGRRARRRRARPCACAATAASSSPAASWRPSPRSEIPLTVVLVDDGGYGMLRFDQELAGDEPFGVDLVGPDFAALGALVRDRGEHRRGLRRRRSRPPCATAWPRRRRR